VSIGARSLLQDSRTSKAAAPPDADPIRSLGHRWLLAVALAALAVGIATASRALSIVGLWAAVLGVGVNRALVALVAVAAQLAGMRRPS
jgi:hypothetical protein